MLPTKLPRLTLTHSISRQFRRTRGSLFSLARSLSMTRPRPRIFSRTQCAQGNERKKENCIDRYVHWFGYNATHFPTFFFPFLLFGDLVVHRRVIEFALDVQLSLARSYRLYIVSLSVLV